MARKTYSDLQTDFLNGTQNPGSTDTTLLSFFQDHLDSRYQLALSILENSQTQQQKTATTTASQQFYHYPVGMVAIQTVTVTVNAIPYPMQLINSQNIWDRLNQLLISPTVIPTFMFPRRDDFGIYPIPQDAYTITFNGNIRDRKMTNADYTTGTVTVTNNSQTVTGSGTTFTSAMVNRWFKYNTDNYWYRISGYTSSTSITLETSFEGTTASGGSYVIGETPEIPEELHESLSAGPIADYFMFVRSDPIKATAFNNYYYTGDYGNGSRTGENIVGGLLGGRKRYAERANSVLVERRPNTGSYINRMQTAKIT